MSFNDRQEITEECPLTKDKSYRFTINNCCTGGLNFIICSFTILTVIITVILALQVFYTDNKLQNKLAVHGAVATDYTNCSQIGTKILRNGGNAVDAAVAATICMTVVAPHKAGLGGGGYIMIYNHKEDSDALVIDFVSNTAEGIFAKLGKRIPAILRGLEFAQAKYGNLLWHEIVEPSVKLARYGFVVSKELAHEISKSTYHTVLYGSHDAGDVLQLHNLADTLSNISQFGSEVIYNGSLTHKVIHDEHVQQEILYQLSNYKPLIGIAENSTFYQHVIYYPHNAQSLKPLLDAVKRLEIPMQNASTTDSQVLIAETLIRTTLLSLQRRQDVRYKRYTGIVAMDWQDTYVSIVTGLSAPLGLQYLTDAGFLLDQINPEVNLSALVPIIFHEKAVCGLRGVFGTDDTLLTAQLLYDLIVRSLNVSNAIENPRYYLLPDGISIESAEKQQLDTVLRIQLNSMITMSQVNADTISKSVNAIIKRKDSMTSHSDSRGGGLASRF